MSGNKWNYLTETLAEYGLWIKTICDLYHLKSNDLCAIRFFRFSSLDIKDVTNYIQLSKRIPIKIDVPISLIPRRDRSLSNYLRGNGTLNIIFSPHPNFSSRRDELNQEKIAEYKLTWQGKSIPVWRAKSEYEYAIVPSDCTFVRQCDLKFFYKVIKHLSRSSNKARKPILPEAMLKEIYDNSIGFLLRGTTQKHKYEEHNIPYKRGILLSGSAGNGKTMTCRWLRELCKTHFLHHKVVTMEEYRTAAAHGHSASCFKLPSKGIIFFDDLDVMLKDRKAGNAELGPFLTALDGMNPINGTINVFTTNYIEELDKTFVRPGRIDLFITFSNPPEKLRHRFLQEMLKEEIQSKICIEDIVCKTDGYSFAELEEIRKLLCLDYIDGKEINVAKTLKMFELHRQEFIESMKIGFKMSEDAHAYSHYDEDFEILCPPSPKY